MKKLFLAMLVVAQAGCALLSPVEKPGVAITSLEIGPASTSGMQQRLLVGLQLDNPNKFALKMSQLRYSVSLAGSSLATGRMNEAVELPALGATSIVVPLDINLLSGLGLIRNLLSATDDLEYKLSLTAAVANFGVGDVTVTKTGQIGMSFGATP